MSPPQENIHSQHRSTRKEAESAHLGDSEGLHQMPGAQQGQHSAADPVHLLRVGRNIRVAMQGNECQQWQNPITWNFGIGSNLVN